MTEVGGNGFRLIADAGSTKVHWACVGSGGEIVGEFFSAGVNPAVMSAEAVSGTIAEALGALDAGGLSDVTFYGAGCRGDEACGIVRGALKAVLGDGVPVAVESDMLGVCRALLGRSAGVACILGTGANSCLYDGDRIIANVSPGGYILGDEGSGAWLGKALLSDYIKGLLPASMVKRFEADYGLDAAEIIRRVYRPSAGEMSPNRFLASFAPFISENIGNAAMRDIAERGFREFFRRNVAAYFTEEAQMRFPLAREVSFAGSVAVAFGDVLREVAASEGFCIAAVMKNPMEGLAVFDCRRS